MVDLVLFGFLKVTVSFTIQPAEPDVGIMHSYIDEWKIEHIEGIDKNDYYEVEDHILECEKHKIVDMKKLIREACERML